MIQVTIKDVNTLKEIAELQMRSITRKGEKIMICEGTNILSTHEVVDVVYYLQTNGTWSDGPVILVTPVIEPVNG